VDSYSISSIGNILYPSVVAVDFENDGDFEIGISTLPQYRKYPDYSIIYEGEPSVWDTGGWAFGGNPFYAKFEPEFSIIKNGIQSGRIEISNCSSYYHDNRLELLHRVDSRNYTESWFEAWYYIPSEVWNDSEPHCSMVFHRISYDRIWSQNISDQGGIYYQQLNIQLTLYVDSRSKTYKQNMFMLTVKGQVDDPPYDKLDDMYDVNYFSNGDYGKGADDHGKFPPPAEPINKILVPKDRWFKVTTYIYRNIDTYLTDPEGGAIKVWIDDKLIWDIPRIRTVGVNPDVLEQEHEYQKNRAFHCIGFSNYGNNGGDASSPMYYYIDNIIISNYK